MNRLHVWVTALPWDSIKRRAKEFNLDQDLIAAMVQTESGGNPLAVRYEPQWKYFFNTLIFAQDLGITQMTENQLQAMSWGPMQIMGSVAREMGFRGHLTKLTDADTALYWSCKKFKTLADKYPEPDCVAAWNGGSPRKTSSGILEPQLEKYVDKVYGYLRELKSLSQTG